MFSDIIQDLLLGLVGGVLGYRQPVVAQFTVERHRGEGGLPAAEELPISDLAALDAVYLPVPRAEAILFVTVEPMLRRGELLNGIAGDLVLEKGYYP